MCLQQHSVPKHSPALQGQPASPGGGRRNLGLLDITVQLGVLPEHLCAVLFPAMPACRLNMLLTLSCSALSDGQKDSSKALGLKQGGISKMPASQALNFHHQLQTLPSSAPGKLLLTSVACPPTGQHSLQAPRRNTESSQVAQCNYKHHRLHSQ